MSPPPDGSSSFSSSSSSPETHVSVSAIAAGFITLPERFFVSPCEDDSAGATVPSLAFLITHPNPRAVPRIPILQTSPSTGKPDEPFRMLFDLGLRSSLEAYTPPQQMHLLSRAPYALTSSEGGDGSGGGLASLLSSGGVDPQDVRLVVLSHVHYDHHGDPEMFPGAVFAVGQGGLNVLKEGLGGIASHQHFDRGLFDNVKGGVVEFPGEQGWTATFGPFPAALDLFGDGAVWVLDAPGHLPGHINLLCRIGKGKWVYLGGDSAHDVRLLTGEKKIATWMDGQGRELCIHLDREGAEKTIGRIVELKRQIEDNGKEQMEVIIAHDLSWYERNRERIFPATL